MVNSNTVKAILSGIEDRLPEFIEFKEKAKKFFEFLVDLDYSKLTKKELKFLELSKTNQKAKQWLINSNSCVDYIELDLLRNRVPYLAQYLNENEIHLAYPKYYEFIQRYLVYECENEKPFIRLSKSGSHISSLIYVLDENEKLQLLEKFKELVEAYNALSSLLDSLASFLGHPNVTLDYIKKNYKSLFNAYESGTRKRNNDYFQRTSSELY